MLFPPLAHLLTPQVAGALAAVAAAALFEPLVRAQFGEKARWGALWFGLAVGRHSLHGPTAVPVRRRRRTRRAAGAPTRPRRGRRPCWRWRCSLASPVAGLFLALAALAYEAVARTRSGALLAGLAVAAPVLLSVGVPRGRVPTVHVPVVRRRADLLRAALRPPAARAEDAARRRGAVRLAATAAYLIDTPMGNNAVRLAELFGGRDRPVLPALAARAAAAARARHRAARRACRVAGLPDRSRRDQERERRVHAGLLLRAAARLPRAGGTRARADRDPVHARALRGVRGGAAVADRARVAAPARHRAQQALLRRGLQRPDLRDLAERERRPLRRAPGRAARLVGPQGEGADRARAVVPPAARGPRSTGRSTR